MPVRKHSVSTDWRRAPVEKTKQRLEDVHIVSHCETHGFTKARFLRLAATEGQTVWRGDCGCEIFHGRFLSMRDDGSVAEFKVSAELQNQDVT